MSNRKSLFVDKTITKVAELMYGEFVCPVHVGLFDGNEKCSSGHTEEDCKDCWRKSLEMSKELIDTVLGD